MVRIIKFHICEAISKSLPFVTVEQLFIYIFIAWFSINIFKRDTVENQYLHVRARCVSVLPGAQNATECISIRLTDHYYRHD